MKLQNFALNNWISGDDAGKELLSAVDGSKIARITSKGIDFAAMLEHAREVGGANLRRYTFHDRANMLKALAKYLLEHKKEFYALSSSTGATRADSWIDIDGGISTLFVFSGKGRREMPNDKVYLDGPPEILSKNGTFVGQHIFTPRFGAAIHINAFNFPVWGMLEKLAPALLAGVPSLVKPATVTSYVTEHCFRLMIDSGLLPEHSCQLLIGHSDFAPLLGNQDSVSFTGSACKLNIHIDKTHATLVNRIFILVD